MSDEAQIVVQPEYSLVEIEETELVVIERESLSIVQALVQGPPGPAGGLAPGAVIDGGNF